jgi:hypothetical protein
MKMPATICLPGLMILLLLLGGWAAGAEAPKDYALLVGVTRYEQLEGHDLRGPINDTHLMAKLLEDHFGFAKEGIHMLTEGAGANRLPTRKNIEAELRHIAEVVQPGDRVVIFLAGHGSLQPQAVDARFPQPDGFDRIFLPRDVGKWDGGVQAVPNAIRGDELGAWLRPIPEKKASLWLILDACHSGQGVRAPSGETTRQIDPEEKGGLEIPHAAMVEGQKRAAERLRGQEEKSRGIPEIRPLPGLEGVTVLYACQSTETTIEAKLPAVAADSKPYGLLTFTLAEVLTRAEAPLTHLELVQRIQGEYVNLGRQSPTPLVEGKDRNREVLGVKEHPRRSLIRLTKDDDGLKITAGAVHGLTEGSTLAVFPPAGKKSDKPLGYVRIIELDTLTAQVEPCKFAGRDAVKDLPGDGRCEVAAIDYGNMKLTVAIDPLDNLGKPVPAEQRQRLAQHLAAMNAAKDSMLSLIDDATRADWLVRMQSEKLYLVPRGGPAMGKDDLPPLFGPYADDEKLVPLLTEKLGRAARATNLTKLATSSPGLLTATDESAGPTGVKLKSEIRRRKNKSDRVGEPVELPNPGLRVYDDDWYWFIIHNPNPYPVDVTLLYVDSGFGISCLFPEPGEVSRVVAGKSSKPVGIHVRSRTSGVENWVLIAMKSQQEEQPADFTALEQDTLEKAQDIDRKRAGPDNGSLDSPLGRLLKHSLYGKGTRAVDRGDLDESGMALLSWRVSKGKRPR